MMFPIFWRIAFACACLGSFMGAVNATETSVDAATLKARLEPTRPRFFLNRADLPAVRERVQQAGVSYEDRRLAAAKEDAPEWTVESAQQWFERQIVNEAKMLDGSYNKWRFHHEIDPADGAFEAAFAYLIEGDALFRDQAAWNLERSLLFYEHRAAQGKGVEWFVYRRLKWLTAFDWIHEGLPEERRTQMMERFIRACRVSLTPPRKSGEGSGGPNSGYYNIGTIKFYLGLAAADMPLDPELARYVDQQFAKGYAEHIQLMEYRERVRGTFGGTSSPTLTYSLLDYPFAMFNFLYCADSALGMDLTQRYPRSFSFVNYAFWNMIFASEDRILEFGTGDLQRTRHGFPLTYLRSHINNLRHFFRGAASTDLQRIAATIDQMLPEGERSHFFFYPYLREPFPPIEPAPIHDFPNAFYFDTMGQTFMRSGTSPDDTYALFTCGGDNLTHAHLDALSFTIYKHGFQAMDTGNRPPRANDNHWAYSTSTTAHNTLLIHMPDEPRPPGNWVMKTKNYSGPQRNFGGQARTTGSQVVAFESNDHYAYVAGDATKTYRSDKVREVTRQFVFVMPDVFVIYDRIVPTDPSYLTQWLLHTAEQPVAVPGAEATYTATHQEGRLVVQTLLPQSPTTKFQEGFAWADGTEVPIAAWDELPPEVQLMQGRWSLQVSAETPAEAVEYLHVIRVQKADAPTPAFQAQSIQTAATSGVNLEVDGLRYTVEFLRQGSLGGQITIMDEAGLTVLRQPLAQAVMEQSLLTQD